MEWYETLANGAKQSKVDARFDLIPALAEERLAEVLGFGASKYGSENWRGIPASSHLNHARRHLVLFKKGDQAEDHVGHALCRIVMWAEQVLQGQQSPGHLNPIPCVGVKEMGKSATDPVVSKTVEFPVSYRVQVGPIECMFRTEIDWHSLPFDTVIRSVKIVVEVA